MAPLSGKQQREYLKFQNKEAREAAKMELDEGRKQQLHEIKLQEAAAKANQGLGHKEQVNNAKLKDMGIPPVRMNKQKLGIPTQNPLAGTGMFKQGQRSLAQAPIFQAQGTDTVPAMLTPGEAVIPAPAAQNPKNKKAIKRMVQEGRKANKLRDGAVDVRYSDAPGQAKYHADGIMEVPSLAYRHPDVPGSSFNQGTERVFSRGSADMQHYNDGTYGVVPQQVQQAAGYNDGTTEVSNVDRFLNWIAGQQIPTTAPLVQPTSQPSDFNTVIEKVFQREYPSEDKAFHIVKGDKGGPTKYGISQKAYPNLDIKNLTKEQAIEIAKRDYWDKNNIDKLDPAMREIYFDTAFNKGSGAAKKIFERSGGDPNKFLDERQKYVDSLVKNNPSQKKFKEGWSNRVNDLRKVAETATDAIIPSAQAGTLPNSEVPAVSPVPKVPAKPSGFSWNRDNMMSGSSTPAPVPPVKETPLFNQNQQDLIRLSEIINDPATTPNDRKWAYTEIDRISKGQIVPSVGAASAQERAKQVMGSNTPFFKANPDLAVVPPTEVKETIPNVEPEKLVEVPKDEKAFNAMIAGFSQQVAPQVDQLAQEAKKIPDPVEQKNFLERSISSLFGKSGLFGEQELLKFSLLAAGGLLTGGSVGGSLRFAGLNTLQSAEKRQAVEAAARAESIKNTRELRERLDSDYRTALGENVPADVRKQAMELYAQADTEAKQRAVINLLKSNKNVEDKDVAKPGTPDQGFFNGKPIMYRSFKGNIQTVDSKGEWSDIKPADLKGFETVERYRANLKDMKDSTVNRLTPILRNAFGKQKNYNAEDEAKGHAEAFSLLKDELGPNISSTSFAKMSENAMRSAVESALSSGKTTLTEEGLRKAFFGNAVIETRITTNNRELYVNKGDKGKIELPSAEYQVALGNALDVYKKQGIPLDQASEQIEKRWNGLSPADKKKFTDMSKGAPGSTPMLYWLRTTGGNI
jgi:hypothetical protein